MIAFVYFFYQLQAISLMCSMVTTVVLAVERYLAVTKPVEYHFAVVAAANQPWRRVMRYMIPTIVFCVIFNLPKYFELVKTDFLLHQSKDNYSCKVFEALVVVVAYCYLHSYPEVVGSHPARS